MKLAFSERPLSKDRTYLKVALIDANPFMDEFKLIVKSDSDKLTIDVIPAPLTGTTGTKVANSYIIYESIIDNSKTLDELKKLLQTELRAKMAKLRLENGLSEVKLK